MLATMSLVSLTPHLTNFEAQHVSLTRTQPPGSTMHEVRRSLAQA